MRRSRNARPTPFVTIRKRMSQKMSYKSYVTVKEDKRTHLTYVDVKSIKKNVMTDKDKAQLLRFRSHGILGYLGDRFIVSSRDQGLRLGLVLSLQEAAEATANGARSANGGSRGSG